MIRIEISTIVELACPRQANLSRKARLDLLERELEEATKDPIAYQRGHARHSSITGRIVEGPIASTFMSRSVDHKPDYFSQPSPSMLEPKIFPGL